MRGYNIVPKTVLMLPCETFLSDPLPGLVTHEAALWFCTVPMSQTCNKDTVG
jgi:hypothetical protein